MSDTCDSKPNEATATVTTPSHTAAGKFAPGNKMGKGNPTARRQAEYRRAFAEAMTPLKMQMFAGKMIEFALAGDMAAARIVCDYTMGRPKGHEEDVTAQASPYVIAPPVAKTA